MRERHLRDDSFVGPFVVTSKDRYITFVSTITELLVTYLGFEYRSVHDGDRRGFTVKPACQVRGRMLGHCSTAECKGSD